MSGKRRVAGNAPREEGAARRVVVVAEAAMCGGEADAVSSGCALCVRCHVPKLGLARGGAGCQGGVRVVFFGSDREARWLGA